MHEQSAPIALAERVATIAAELGIPTAVIGAFALAAHHYVRATRDFDLATAISLPDLERLEQAVVADGLSARLRTPDDIDPLGGVLVVWTHTDEDGDPVEPVEVVNFRNPYRPRATPGVAAIRDAAAVPGSALRFPQLHDLIALKLYAGGKKDLADIVEVLVHNPGANVDAIRTACRAYDTANQIDTLIAEAAERRARH